MVSDVYGLFWLGPALVALLACTVGWHARDGDARWWNRALQVLLAVAVAAVVVGGFALREDVPAGQFVFGVVAGMLGLAIPLVVFYTLGYFVRRPWLVALLWFGGSFLLGPYAFGAWLVFALGVACEPGCLS